MFKLAYRYMKSNIKSSIRAVFGIAFSIMLMFSLVQISGYIMDSFKELVSTGMRRDFTVYNISGEETIEIHHKLTESPVTDKQKIMSMIWVGSVYETELEEYKVLGVSGDIDYFKDTRMISNSLPTGNNEICIEKSYADRKNLKAGDEISLNIFFFNELSGESAEKTFDFTISSIIDDLVDDGTYFFTSLPCAVNIIKESGISSDNLSNSIAFETIEGDYDVEKTVDAEYLIKDILATKNPEKAETFFKECIINNDQKSMNYDEKGTFTSVSFGVLAISVIIALCMIIFVYNSLNISLIQKLDNLAVMRCIGMNNRQLAQMVLAEAIILTNISFVAGVVAGNLLNMLVAEKIVGTLIQGGADVSISQNPIIYLTVYILAMLSVLIACVRLILRFYKIKPINLSKFGSGKEIKSNFSKGGLSGKRYFYGFATRNIKRNFSKSITQIVTVSLSYLLCFVICNTFLTVSTGSSKSLADICDYSLKADIVLSQSCFTEVDVDVLKDKYKIDTIYTQSDLMNEVECNVNDNSVQPIVYSNNLASVLAKNLKLDYNSEKPFAVLIGEGCSDKKDISVKVNDKEHIIKLNGSYDDVSDSLQSVLRSIGTYLLMNEKAASEIGCKTDTFSSVLLETNEKITIESINEEFEGIELVVEDMNEGKKQSAQQLLGIVMLAIYIVAATILLSFMIINNTIRENAVTRKREFGIMCAIGMKRKSLCKICCWENVILNVISCVAGTVLSLPINIYITMTLHNNIRVSATAYVVVIAVFTTVTAFFSYLFMKKYSNSSIVDMIKID
ncbi:MAG: FtsX-like permease family protein [Ruminococcus sp.]|nr:FtsX-like permease family protein [Ruminococcus sp.]